MEVSEVYQPLADAQILHWSSKLGSGGEGSSPTSTIKKALSTEHRQKPISADKEVRNVGGKIRLVLWLEFEMRRSQQCKI